MSLPIYRGKCMNCGKEALTGYLERQWNYGSPVRQCKKCGFAYLDRRYHEIEVEGFEPDALSVKRSGLAILLGLAAVIGGALFIAGEIYMSGYYHTGAVTIAFIGTVLIGWGIIDIIRIKTGLKAKKLEKLRLESEARLSDKNYARLLAEQGYNVPQKYLE